MTTRQSFLIALAFVVSPASSLRADEVKPPELQQVCRAAAEDITDHLRRWKNALASAIEIRSSFTGEIDESVAVLKANGCEQFPYLLPRAYYHSFNQELTSAPTEPKTDDDLKQKACEHAIGTANDRLEILKIAKARGVDNDNMSNAAKKAPEYFVLAWKLMGCEKPAGAHQFTPLGRATL